jgi:Transposase
MIVIPASLRSDFIHMAGMTIHIALESTIHIVGIRICHGYAVLRSLVLSFRTILRTGKIKTLHAWMKKAKASGLYRLQRFVRRLKQDQSAIEAAVEQSWSNGPLEGHINLLKTLKRQMYGRAGFELLRARVLRLPPSAILHHE